MSKNFYILNTRHAISYVVTRDRNVSFQAEQPLSSFVFERLSSACSQLLRMASQSSLPHLPWVAALFGRVQVGKQLRIAR
jgi:hypothetical protein